MILRRLAAFSALGLPLLLAHAGAQQPAAPPKTPPASSTSAPQRPAQVKRDVGKLYTELCASCHGPNMSGGQAPTLLDDVWKFGGDDVSLTASITDGRPAVGMPPFGQVLSPQDVRAMVIYIREQKARYDREKATYAKPAEDTVVQSERHPFRVETVVSGLEQPWSVAFLPDGRLLVTEKPGRLRIVENGKLVPEPVGATPPVWAGGQGGMLDVAVHPQYASNGWIYLSYSDPGPNGSAMTAVVRGKLQNGQFVEQQTLFKAPTELYRTGTVHFGSRFVFDGKGHVFFSIGERGQKDDAQDLSRPNGKVHRINEDGSIPPDNPFVEKAGAVPSIWSYGNRNPQGLAQHPVTGELWEAEHGPRGGDEINIIRPGRNYGWPVITYGMNYDGTPMTDKTAAPGLEQPILHWTPSIAVCAIDFYTGDKFPGWKNDLLVGALAQEEVRRLTITDGKVVNQEVLFKGIGRVRDVVNGPDGFVYVVFDSGRIGRIVPASGSGPTTQR